MAEVYCQGVLCHDQRIALTARRGKRSTPRRRNLATKQLAQLAARKAAKKAAEAAAPAVVKPKHAPAPAPPTKTPQQLRDRVRAALVAPARIAASGAFVNVGERRWSWLLP